MQKRDILRKIIHIFFILLLILFVLEFLTYGCTGGEFFTNLSTDLPALWRFLLQHPERYMSWLCYVAVGLVLVIFYCVVFPLLLLAFNKCKCYFTLWFTCLRNHHTFKICRVPFLSLHSVGEKPDIKIGMGEKTLHIHFIDIPFATRRIVTLLNRREYSIRPTNVYRVGPVVFREENMFFRRDKYRGRRKKNSAPGGVIKQIPAFSSSHAEYHVMVVMPGYAAMHITKGVEQIGIGGETWYEDIMFCRAKTLQKRLRGELQASFGPSQQK